MPKPHIIGENRQRGPQSEHWIECATCDGTVRGTALRTLEEEWNFHQSKVTGGHFQPRAISMLESPRGRATDQEVHEFLVRVAEGRTAEFREVASDLRRIRDPEGNPYLMGKEIA